MAGGTSSGCLAGPAFQTPLSLVYVGELMDGRCMRNISRRALWQLPSAEFSFATGHGSFCSRCALSPGKGQAEAKAGS